MMSSGAACSLSVASRGIFSRAAAEAATASGAMSTEGLRLAHDYSRFRCLPNSNCRSLLLSLSRAKTNTPSRPSRSMSSLPLPNSAYVPAAPETLRSLYPPIDAYETGFLPVSSVHTLYYEQSGNPKGNPVVFLHGGPGGGTSADDRRYFDPAVYRIVLFDQRGAGKSTPHASLEDNNTWALVEDIEKLRVQLGIERWVVFGGSWGSSLALAYAETYTERVKALILRGIFTLRRSELLWYYQDGASHIFPEFWEEYLAPIPENERRDLMSAYYKRLTGSNPEEQLRCAKAWSKWETSTSKIFVDPEFVSKADNDFWALAFARIECHYFVENGWFREGQLIEDAKKLAHVPATIVQGRYDVVCPARSAWDLHKAYPTAEFYMIPDAGHSARERGITSKLIEAADKYKTL